MEQLSYHRPADLAGLRKLLIDRGAGARFLAGGQQLVPLLSRAPWSFEAVIDLGAIAALRQIEVEPDAVTIGAMVTLAEAQRALKRFFPVIARSLARSASIAIRNRATVGGSAALREATSETFAFLHAYDATMVLLDANGEQVQAIGETTMPGMAIIGLRIPHAHGERAGFSEIVRRQSGGRALAMAFARSRPGGQLSVTVSAGSIGPIRLCAEMPIRHSIGRLDAPLPVRAWMLAAATRAIEDMV
jgi:carbon-monoxide dehydrogenase medium subunit